MGHWDAICCQLIMPISLKPKIVAYSVSTDMYEVEILKIFISMI